MLSGKAKSRSVVSIPLSVLSGPGPTGFLGGIMGSSLGALAHLC